MLRSHGFSPAGPDSVVLTYELAGEPVSQDTDSGPFSYFWRHQGELFSRLDKVYRGRLTQQAANLWSTGGHIAPPPAQAPCLRT